MKLKNTHKYMTSPIVLLFYLYYDYYYYNEFGDYPLLPYHQQILDNSRSQNKNMLYTLSKIFFIFFLNN